MSLADVSSVHRGISYPAAKTILMMRSPVLKMTLKSDFLEKVTSVLDWTNLNEDVSSEAVRAFIRYLYVDDLEAEIGVSTVLELIQLAHLYEVNGLFDRCDRYLKTHLDASNTLKILRIARNLAMSSEMLVLPEAIEYALFYGRDASEFDMLKRDHSLNEFLKSYDDPEMAQL